MTILQSGSALTAAIVPDLYVQLLSPTVSALNGVPTNLIGIVGTATWGPVAGQTPVSTMQQYAQMFGPLQAKKYDLGTACACAILQGANNIVAVRVTDGTDVAATFQVGSAPANITFTSLYTGSLGNTITVQLATGSAANSTKCIVTLPGRVPEVFDNVTGNANAFWVNLALAINNGQSGVRGPSQIITAVASSGTASPSSTTYTLATGSDGATSITGSVLTGNDGSTPRKGMYALRGSGASIVVLADVDDSTTYANQVSYGLSEGSYMIMTGPSGQSVSTAVSAKVSAGVDSYAAKILVGDWVYFNDSVNNQVRLVSPQAFVAGCLANLGPQESGLNKQILGVVGTQTSSANYRYSYSDISLLAQNSLDVITNPIPGAQTFGIRLGHNTSSNPVIHSDSYTRMSNYIVSTINAGMGRYVGKLQSPDVRASAIATLQSFFHNLWNKGLIGNASGTLPFSVQIDDNNNPMSQVALGYMVANVKVTYLSVIEYFLIQVEGGSTVTVTSTNVQTVGA